jgi:hypothetical protein
VAIIGTALALAFVGLLMYWPHLFIKNSAKREWAWGRIGLPLMCLVIVLVIALSHC